MLDDLPQVSFNGEVSVMSESTSTPLAANRPVRAYRLSRAGRTVRRHDDEFALEAQVRIS